jgi:phospholipid transport system substrate-binding protein
MPDQVIDTDGGKPMLRRQLLLYAASLTVGGVALPFPALGAEIAEAFIANNIRVGFELLNDHTLTNSQRKAKFASFLLSITDIKRVAKFLIGKYAASASPLDIDVYVAAYQGYILAVYQSYFSRYAGQSLRVIDTQERAPNDFIVRTNIIGESDSTGQEIGFRVRTDGARPVLIDLSVGGLWLAAAQRDEFAAVLAQNGGDLGALITSLQKAQDRYAYLN